ncbi:PIN-like domain-containing protein [Solibacillus cecembensis]|uniref:PIN-like domain-containing protein n=1 Tax=Solibacillus cecembensis TaxID=459347 RepID=UPI003CFEF431
MSQNIELELFKTLIEDEQTLIVFDTSSLLHFFECSPDLTAKIIENLSTIEHKLWIPHQVYNEYSNKKDSVKQREMNKFRNIINNYIKHIDSLENEYGKLHLRYRNYNINGIIELENDLNNGIEIIKNRLTLFRQERTSDEQENRLLFREDNIETFIHNIISSGKIGSPFTLNELLSIYQEGEVRFKYAIPPGYKDGNKDTKDLSNRAKFGDLIIWKEILQKVQEHNQNIIFIMEDNKPDWWEINNSVLIGPKQELIKEFNEISESGREFIMLGTSQFSSLLSLMYEDIKSAMESFIEDNCEDIILNSIEDIGLDNLIELYTTFTSRLIHGGELQPYIEYPLTDVELTDINELEIEEINISFSEDSFEIEARISANVEGTIESTASSEFVQYDEVTINIAGKIIANYVADFTQFTEEFENTSLNIENISILDTEIEHTDFDVKGDVSDLMLCKDCFKPADYQHATEGLVCSKCSDGYQLCSKCGMFFDELHGVYCYNCEMNE